LHAPFHEQFGLCRLLLIDGCNAYAVPDCLAVWQIQCEAGGSDEHFRVAILPGLRCRETDANRDDARTARRVWMPRHPTARRIRSATISAPSPSVSGRMSANEYAHRLGLTVQGFDAFNDWFFTHVVGA
jgi:hypothetical protein